MMRNPTTRSQIDFGSFSAPVVTRVNKRAKRLILKVDPVAGEVHLTIPSKRCLKEAMQFAVERGSWIADQLDQNLRARPFAHGTEFSLMGAPFVLNHSGGVRSLVRQIAGEPNILSVGGDPAHVNRRTVDWLKQHARRVFAERSDFYCQQIDRQYRAIRIRDTRSRWGSCSASGVLSYSWRLVLAPRDIVEYVAAHECVHLIHMNHSPAYWRDLAALGVDARGAKEWFRLHGQGLFSYGAQPTSPTQHQDNSDLAA